MKLKRALIVPDCHRPFHSRKAYALMLEVALYLGVDEIVLLGDYADFYSVSHYVRSADPRLPQLLIDEVESVNLGLDELDRLFPRAKKIYLEGNHEIRLEKYIESKAPALFGVTECRGLFQMHARPRWSYVGFGRSQKHRVLGSDLLARHKPIASNPMTGLRRAFASYCYGHNHHIEQAHAVGLDGQQHVAFSCGWLGDHRADVFGYMLDPPQWQLGFALATVAGPSKQFHHEIVEIKSNYTCLTHGKLFKA